MGRPVEGSGMIAMMLPDEARPGDVESTPPGEKEGFDIMPILGRRNENAALIANPPAREPQPS
jgi:hypothetical protein